MSNQALALHWNKLAVNAFHDCISPEIRNNKDRSPVQEQNPMRWPMRRCIRLGGLLLGAFLFIAAVAQFATCGQDGDDERDSSPAPASADRAKTPKAKARADKPDRFDAVVDAFIDYDIGKLRGAQGFKANQDFHALSGDEVIPALVRGANKAAKMQNSCPIIMIAMKLQSHLQQAKSREALQYAAAHLDSSGANMVYGSYIDSLRAGARTMLRQFDGLPPAAEEDTNEVRGGGTAGQLRRSKKPIDEWSQADLLDAVLTEEGPPVVRALEELKDRKGAESTDTLAKAIGALGDEIRPLARGLLAQRLVRMTDETLKTMLADENVEIRAAAASAAGYKGSPLCPELAKAVADKNPLVAANAHQSLVKLSGEDLGPADGAKFAERFTASKRWTRWIDERHATRGGQK
jgi:hypothetical protein